MVVSGERWREEAAGLRIQRPQVWRASSSSGGQAMDLSAAIEALASADEVELEAIDTEIEQLQRRIERLKRVRRVLGAPAPKGGGRVSVDYEKQETRIMAAIRNAGPLRPKELGERLGLAYMTIGKVARASKRLRRLEDGRITLAEAGA